MRLTWALRPPPFAVGIDASTSNARHARVPPSASLALAGVAHRIHRPVHDRAAPASLRTMVTRASHDALSPTNPKSTRASAPSSRRETLAFHHAPSASSVVPNASVNRASLVSPERCFASSIAILYTT